MSTITILKDVNKVKKNNYHTIRININEFVFEEKGGNYVRKTLSTVKTITGWMKDTTYKEILNSTWSPIFSSDNSMMETLNKGLSLTGIGSLKTKAMYLQIWKNSTPVEIPLTLFFQAEDYAKSDIVFPIRYLQEMCVPEERVRDKKRESGKSDEGEENKLVIKAKKILNTLKVSMFDKFLLPPASSTVNVSNISDPTSKFIGIGSVEIGNFITLKDVYLENVEVDWDILNNDINGDPLSATVMCKFKSRSIWTTETIKNLRDGSVDTNLPMEVMDFGKAFRKIKEKMKEVKGEK